jgi:hypothetical protein
MLPFRGTATIVKERRKVEKISLPFFIEYCTLLGSNFGSLLLVPVIETKIPSKQRRILTVTYDSAFLNGLGQYNNAPVDVVADEYRGGGNTILLSDCLNCGIGHERSA